jgi:hypothetical protein
MLSLKALLVVAHLHCDLAKYAHNVADRMTIKTMSLMDTLTKEVTPAALVRALMSFTCNRDTFRPPGLEGRSFGSSDLQWHETRDSRRETESCGK